MVRRLRFSGPKTSIICTPMTSLKTSIKTITYLSDTGCLEIQGASLGWQIDPAGLRYSLNWFWDHFQLPLFIVENGFGAVDQRQADGTVNDHYRIDYFASHIREMKKAVVEDGVDLIGYTPWGCIDLVSAGTGEMKKRYGMIYVDKDNEGKGTLERIRKASFYWYRDLIANNGENI
ncbi:glycosyl hydrolase 1 family protein [Shigella sonnei 3226-85]|nr:glycosyl hydrolase 1 family protein [Shigella sonnei 3226-85]